MAAVDSESLPLDAQTLLDFGFDKGGDAYYFPSTTRTVQPVLQLQQALLGLYTMLVKSHGVNAKELHSRLSSKTIPELITSKLGNDVVDMHEEEFGPLQDVFPTHQFPEPVPEQVLNHQATQKYFQQKLANVLNPEELRRRLDNDERITACNYVTGGFEGTDEEKLERLKEFTEHSMRQDKLAFMIVL